MEVRSHLGIILSLQSFPAVNVSIPFIIKSIPLFFYPLSEMSRLPLAVGNLAVADTIGRADTLLL